MPQKGMAFIYTLIIIDLPNSDGYALKGEELPELLLGAVADI